MEKASNFRFRRQLEKIMEEKNLTAGQLAVFANISKSVIYSWMRGSTPKDLSAVVRLAHNLDLTLHEMLFGEKESTEMTPQHSSDAFKLFFEGKCRILVKESKSEIGSVVIECFKKNQRKPRVEKLKL